MRNRHVICDIDGTIALMVNRSPYEWDRVDEDLPNEHVVKLLKTMMAAEYVPIFLTGRPESSRIDTEDWLSRELGLEPGTYRLIMRSDKDRRPSHEYKADVYVNHIRGKHLVELVLEDRSMDVAMWRQLGLTCLQVADGDF